VTTRDGAARRARDCASGVVGRLNIGLPAAPVINCVSSPIAEFHLEHPDVLLEMHEKFSGELSFPIPRQKARSFAAMRVMASS
jgi:DNA-binding transcriptional LysR family regulator